MFGTPSKNGMVHVKISGSLPVHSWLFFLSWNLEKTHVRLPTWILDKIPQCSGEISWNILILVHLKMIKTSRNPQRAEPPELLHAWHLHLPLQAPKHLVPHWCDPHANRVRWLERGVHGGIFCCLKNLFEKKDLICKNKNFGKCVGLLKKVKQQIVLPKWWWIWAN